MSSETTAMTVQQAAFIGVGAMVGAGIFALIGPAGGIAGAAVWLSFLLAGVIAALQGYSFGKMGARFPSGSGLIEYVARGFGDGHFTGITAWLAFMSQCIITAMVAVSFGGYTSSMFADGDPGWSKVFTVLLLLTMGALNMLGGKAVARAQGVIVRVVLAILVVFSVVTVLTADWALLAPSGYPTLRQISSSVALTFFAFLGFGVITFTAKDLPEPTRQLPRAIYLAIAIATVVYVAISLGVYGTLTVPEVIAAGDTAVAEAAKPTLGDLGFTLMALTAMFSTAGATNSSLYPATGLARDLAAKEQFPPVLGRDLGGRVPVGLLLMVGATTVLALFLDLTAIASIGSAVALTLFTLVTISHMRVRRVTGAKVTVLVVALLLTLAALFSFVTTTLLEEPVTMATLGGLAVLAVGLDAVWKRGSWARSRTGRGTRPRCSSACATTSRSWSARAWRRSRTDRRPPGRSGQELLHVRRVHRHPVRVEPVVDDVGLPVERPGAVELLQVREDLRPVGGRLAAEGVELLDPAVREHTEVLAAQVGDARGGSCREVPRLGGAARRAEHPSPVQEVPVRGADPGLARRGDGRQRQRAHAREHRRELGRRDRAAGHDRAQVLRGPGQRGVQQRLQVRHLLGCLTHAATVAPATDTGAPRRAAGRRRRP